MKVVLYWNMFHLNPLASYSQIKCVISLGLYKINWKVSLNWMLSKNFWYLWKAKFIYSNFCNILKCWQNVWQHVKAKGSTEVNSQILIHEWFYARQETHIFFISIKKNPCQNFKKLSFMKINPHENLAV